MSNRLRPDFGLDWDADCIQVRSTNLERTVDVYLPAQAQQEIIFYGQSALDELRPAVNLWTDAQRLAILLLRDCSELDWEDVKRIFNRVRKESRPTRKIANYIRLFVLSLHIAVSFAQAQALMG